MIVNETKSKQNIEHLLFEFYIDKDEYIDYKTINLNDEFDQLNRLLFNNKIIRNIPLKFESNKKRLGWLKYNTQRYWKDESKRIFAIKKNPLSLGISNTFKQTYKTFLNTLAHEMIHLYLMQNNLDEKDDHGPAFLKIANEINGKGLGFNITIKNDEGLTVKNIPKQPFGIIMIKIERFSANSVRHCDLFWSAIKNIKEIVDSRERIFNFWNQYSGNKAKVFIVESRDPRAALYLHRSIKTKQKYQRVLKEEIFDEVLRTSRILYKNY
jgi:hypothetical protein